jgi:hypothetical protein
MAVDGDAVDRVDAKRTRRERRYRNGWGDDRINLIEYFQERRTQTVAAIAGLDIFNAAVGSALRHHIAVVAVGGHQRIGTAGRDGRGLLGICDRFQDPLEHIRFKLHAVGNDAGAK